MAWYQLILLDFILTTFTGGDDVGATPSPYPGSEEGDNKATVSESSDKLRVKAKLTSIVFVLNNDGEKLATISLSAADVSILLRGPTMRVAARLGNLSVIDELADDSTVADFKRLLTIEGDELADFQYEKFDPSDRQTYPGYDTSIYLRTGSLKCVFVEESIHRLIIFFSKFARMKALYDAATQAAVAQAADIQGGNNKGHYDVLIRTPILMFPRDPMNPDRITVNPGEISAITSFAISGVTKITAGLRSIHLKWETGYDHTPFSIPMLDDVNLKFDISLLDSIDRTQDYDRPGTQVNPVIISSKPT
jgi:vacuolar protein sorting-associated protein 13A/C